MTLNGPNCWSASGFYHSFKSNYLKMYVTDLRSIFSIGSLTGVDDCCKIGLLSLKGRCHGNHFRLFSPHIFLHSDQCVIYFVHSATTRPIVVGVMHEVDRWRVLLTTQIHRRLAVACHGKRNSALIIHRIWFECDGIRQEVRVLRWTQVNRLIAKFHYTDPTRTPPDPHGLFCGETPLGPCGSGRVRVVEFSYNWPIIVN